MDRGIRILIVEDEVIIALDLAFAVEDAGGLVIGPAASTVEALALIEESQASERPIAAAVLDANLLDRDVTPVALQLLDLGVPIVIHSAVGIPPAIKAVASDTTWLCKPTPAQKVVAQVFQEIERAALSPASPLT